MSVREHSAVGEVRALGHALELLRARAAGDTELDDALDDLYDRINELDGPARSVAVADLIMALVRFGRVLAIAATRPSEQVTIDDALEIAYASLCKASLEHEPAADDSSWRASAASATAAMRAAVSAGG